MLLTLCAGKYRFAESLQPLTRQKETQRAHDFDEIQAEQNLKIVSRRRRSFGAFAAIVIFRPLHRHAIELMMEQMAQPKYAKRRAEQNRQQPAG